MNSTQVMGIVRDIIKALGVIVVAYGYVDEETLAMVAGAVATIVASAWSWYTNMTSTMISTVASSSDVKKVVTTPAIAKADPNPKVTST